MRENILFSVGVKDSHTPEGFEPGTVIVCANCVLMAAYFVGILGESTFPNIGEIEESNL